MNNFDTGQNLLSEAREFYDEMLRAYERKSWNIAIRRAQETVELSLKGILKIMMVEYPKSHDVAGVFERACIEQGLGIEVKFMDELKQISSDLAEKRGPAFYAERIYDEQDAGKAKISAERVLVFAESLAKRLKSNSRDS